MQNSKDDKSFVKNFLVHNNCGLSLYISPKGDVYQNTVHGMIKIPNPPLKN